MIDLIRWRSHNQKLARADAVKPADVVAWLGAVQAQDYSGAKWAIGLRGRRLTDEDVERAFTNGDILRTHVLRPTWHFVCPADIRWMLALTAPRVKAVSRGYFRKLELDGGVFARSQRALERALEGGGQLTRAELASVLERVGIAAQGIRLAYLMMHAELDQVICSGARRGKQFTYALLEERAPDARRLTRDEALSELSLRYFSSHGPATIRDFAWWSGLAGREARIGAESVRPALRQETIGGRRCWFAATPRPGVWRSPRAWLLPNYDEYLIAYKDRSSRTDQAGTRRAPTRAVNGFPHHLVADGQVAGAWTRTLKKDAVTIAVAPDDRLNRSQRGALQAAAARLGTFLSLPVRLVQPRPGALTQPGARGSR